jgi:hypothetical protein
MLRSDEFNREQQMKTAADARTRQLLQQRLDEIDDSLRDVNAEGERLKNFSRRSLCRSISTAAQWPRR